MCTNSLSQNIKEGIDGRPVDWYNDVFDLVFPNIDPTEANTRWKKELVKPPREELDDDADSDK
jgi:Lon-like ATP-dependent protease